ncbi:hypothetical protein F4801DRAFT_562493 [Xylaria longipes]|nr:hypothetical protein F4801DRAFT_562493 [Xylaria longipes]
MPRGRTCIIRAHGNGLSRLATLVACTQKEFECYILPPHPCYLCVAETLEREPSKGDSVVLICYNAG